VSETENRFLVDAIVGDIDILYKFGALQELAKLIDWWLLFFITYTK
jgi:hypothetical protein